MCDKHFLNTDATPLKITECIKNVFNALGHEADFDKIDIVDRGQPHTAPRRLPNGKMAIYTFIYEGDFLKIGKVGPNSNARYTSQHYHPNASRSNLAKSILDDIAMKKNGITESNVGEWIKNNCRRIDIEIDAELGFFALELIEALLHYEFTPKYEGYSSQR